MAIQFHANHVTVTREHWGWIVGWSVDDDRGAEQYLILQAPNEYSGQDRALGMDDVYVEVCGQGWSWYGNIESFQLSPNAVEAQVSPKAAEHMGNDGKVAITFSMEPARFEELRDVLRRVFSGRDFYQEVLSN